MSLCVAKEIVRRDCLFWESYSWMKKDKSGICKSNGSSVYYRIALNQSSRARFHPGFVSYHAESAFTWSETSGESAVYLWDRKPSWNLALDGWFQAALDGWFQAALVYCLEASKSRGMEGDREGPTAETGKQMDFQKG